jgi:hypothetical protein
VNLEQELELNPRGFSVQGAKASYVIEIAVKVRIFRANAP